MSEKKQKKPSGTSRKSSLEERLVEGEKIVMQAEISPGIYWKSLAVLLFAFIVGTLVIELGIVLAVAGALLFLYAFIKKKILLLVLTNKRIFARYGILQVDVVDMRFSKIESVELERMLPGYIMGYANLILMGTGQRYIVIPYVKNGPQLRQAYNRMVLEDDKKEDDDEA